MSVWKFDENSDLFSLLYYTEIRARMKKENTRRKLKRKRQLS